MKTIVMFHGWALFPIAQGSERVIVEIARYLNGLPDIRLKLVLLGEEKETFRTEYAKICDEVVWLKMPRRWSFWSTLNKFVSRMGIDVLNSWCVSREIAGSVRKHVVGADAIIINYTSWFSLLPRNLRKTKTMVLTYDVGFYRRASFKGADTLMKRFFVVLNRKCELRVLRSFNKIGVLADYEANLLMSAGVETDSIIRIGMPITVAPRPRSAALIKYDFAFLGGKSYQNEEGVKCFFKRVAPLLSKGNHTVAVIGAISGSTSLDSICIPKNFQLVRIGYVDDVQEPLQKCGIAVATLPYGSGIKVKVVESILNGLPVILTNSGAEGIPVTPEGSINIDEQPDGEVVKRIRAWLMDKEKLIRDGAAQERVVREAFSPEVCLLGLRKWVEEINYASKLGIKKLL